MPHLQALRTAMSDLESTEIEIMKMHGKVNQAREKVEIAQDKLCALEEALEQLEELRKKQLESTKQAAADHAGNYLLKSVVPAFTSVDAVGNLPLDSRFFFDGKYYDAGYRDLSRSLVICTSEDGEKRPFSTGTRVEAVRLGKPTLPDKITPVSMGRSNITDLPVGSLFFWGNEVYEILPSKNGSTDVYCKNTTTGVGTSFEAYATTVEVVHRAPPTEKPSAKTLMDAVGNLPSESQFLYRGVLHTIGYHDQALKQVYNRAENGNSLSLLTSTMVEVVCRGPAKAKATKPAKKPEENTVIISSLSEDDRFFVPGKDHVWTIVKFRANYVEVRGEDGCLTNVRCNLPVIFHAPESE